MLKLNDLATANGSNLENAFDGLLAGLGSSDRDRVREFLDWAAATCRITVNVKLFVVADLLSGGKYLNIYERAALDAGLFGLAAEGILRNTLGGFYDRRMAFDAAFERGREFLYGALTAGNGGLRRTVGDATAGC